MKKFPAALVILVLAAIVFSSRSSSAQTSNRSDYLSLLESYNKARGNPLDVSNLYVQNARLFAADGTESDLFGAGVAISGDTAVVSTDFAFSPGNGEVFVFVRSGSQWNLQQRLTASDGVQEDKFGQAMAIDGDTLVIGAWGNFIYRGKAYVFVRSGGVWTEQAKLLASDGQTSDRFGTSIAVSGNTVVVGAFFANDAVNVRTGAAYIFTRNGTTWTQQQKLTQPGTTWYDSFGRAVAIAGDELFVTCPGCNPTPERPDVGLVEYFTRSGNVWTSQQKLVGSETLIGDAFGSSVAVSGDTMIVGAASAGTGTTAAQGEAYIFTRSGGTWSQQQKLTPATGSENSKFGSSVAIDGGTAVVGAPSTTWTPHSQGRVSVFTRTGSTWLEQSLVAQNGQPGDFFGQSVGVSGSYVIGGAPLMYSGTVYRAGLAFIFANPTTNVTVGGRVLAANGRGVYNVPVSMSDSQGQTRYAMTNPFGYYRFANIVTNNTYTFEVASKRPGYAPLVVTLTGELTNLDFTPQP